MNMSTRGIPTWHNYTTLDEKEKYDGAIRSEQQLHSDLAVLDSQRRGKKVRLAS